MSSSVKSIPLFLLGGCMRLAGAYVLAMCLIEAINIPFADIEASLMFGFIAMGAGLIFLAPTGKK